MNCTSDRDTNHLLAPPSPVSFLRPERIGLVLVLAACCVLFAPALRYQFVYDDAFQIVQNDHVHSWHFLPLYFTRNVWSQVPNNATNLYRPLFLVWLRLNDMLFHDEAMGWHLTSLLVHLLVTTFVYLLARALLLEGWASAVIAALVFAVHPIHVEAVAWVSGVTESLCCALLLASFLSYLRQRRSPRHRQLWLGLSLVLFAAGCFAKETAAVLPGLIAAYEWTFGRKEHPPSTLRRMRDVSVKVSPYLAVLVFYLLARAFVMGSVPHQGETALRVSVASMPLLFWIYIKTLLWPVRLSPLYDFPYVSGFRALDFLLPASCIAALAALFCLRRSKNSFLEKFLALWFVIALAPSFAAFCLANASESYHDRYLYVPSVAFAIFCGVIFQRLSSHGRAAKVAAWGFALLIAGVLAFITARQIPYWKSNYALFERANSVAPQNELAAANFSAELIKVRDYSRALKLSRAMMELHPGTVPPLRTAASAAFLLHDYETAESDYMKAVALGPSQEDLLYMLGLTQMRLGKYADASLTLRRAVSAAPQQPFVHYTLGVALSHMNDWAGAKQQFLAELQLNADISFLVARQALLDADGHLRSTDAHARATSVRIRPE